MEEPNANKLRFLDELSTEALESFLRADAENLNTTEADTEVTLYIMKLLERRARESGTRQDTEKAWKAFKKDYLPLVGEEALYAPEEEEETPRRKSRTIPFLKRMAVTAAMLVLVLTAAIFTAYAMGYPIWEYVAQWTSGTLQLVPVGREPAAVIETDYRDMQTELIDVLTSYHIDANLVPRWLPDGYVLDHVEDSAVPTEALIAAAYRNGDQYMMYVIYHKNIDDGGQSANIWEIDEDSVQTFTVGDNTCYLSTNEGQVRVNWHDGQDMLEIAGCPSEQDAREMVASIYLP